MRTNNRRNFLKKSLLIVSSLLFGGRSLANINLLDTKVLSLLPEKQSLLTNPNIKNAKKVRLSLPKKSTNSSLVPIVINALKRKDVRNIYIIVDHNLNALVATVHLTVRSLPYFATRIKVEQTSTVRAIIETDEGYEQVNALINIVNEGCSP